MIFRKSKIILEKVQTKSNSQSRQHYCNKILRIIKLCKNSFLYGLNRVNFYAHIILGRLYYEHTFVNCTTYTNVNYLKSTSKKIKSTSQGFNLHRVK